MEWCVAMTRWLKRQGCDKYVRKLVITWCLVRMEEACILQLGVPHEWSTCARCLWSIKFDRNYTQLRLPSAKWNRKMKELYKWLRNHYKSFAASRS
jgi:hypothetical protein